MSNNEAVSKHYCLESVCFEILIGSCYRNLFIGFLIPQSTIGEFVGTKYQASVSSHEHFSQLYKVKLRRKILYATQKLGSLHLHMLPMLGFCMLIYTFEYVNRKEDFKTKLFNEGQAMEPKLYRVCRIQFWVVSRLFW